VQKTTDRSHIVLKYALFIRGVFHTEFAKSIGSTKQVVDKWFIGARPIPFKYHNDIEKFINMPMDFLSKTLTNELKIKVLEYEIERLKGVR
jgi:hypothetical protein